MKYALVILVMTQLMGAAQARQSTCSEVKEDLRSIERHLLDAKAGSDCGNLTAEQINLPNLTAEQKTYFESIRCRRLPALDEELSIAESRLLVSDGLTELRQATVNRQNMVQNLNLSSGQKNEVVTRFGRDVALGALIQDLVDPKDGVVSELRATAGEDWDDKISKLCRRTEMQPKPFCQTYGETPGDLVMAELNRFLNTLNDDNSNSKSLASYQALFAMESNGKKTSFFDLWQEMRNNDFHEFLLESPGKPTPRPTTKQMQIVRKLNLSVPGAETNPFLKQLVERMKGDSDQLETRGQTEILKLTMQDTVARHMARAKARWSQVWATKNPGERAPCLDDPNVQFGACVAGSAAALNLTPDMKETLQGALNSAQYAINTETSIGTCLEPTKLTASLETGVAAASPCKEAGLTEVSEEQAKRVVLMGLRSHIARKESAWLQYRDRALDEAKNCDDLNMDSIGPNAACMGLSSLNTVKPLITLSLDSLQIIDNGLRAPGSLVIERDCTKLPQELGVICSRANQAEVVARTEKPGPVLPGKIKTRPIEADHRNRALEKAIVADALNNAMSDVGKAYFANKLATQNFASTLPVWPSTSSVGYSTPISGFANYILAYGQTNLGYGSYYNSVNCPACGFSSNNGSFQSFYGIGMNQNYNQGAYFGGLTSLSSIPLVGQFGQ